MIIIKLWGGLGNQMFQYALYRSFKEKSIPVRLDRSIYKKGNTYAGYELEEIFHINGSYSTVAANYLLKPLSKLLYKIIGRPYKETNTSFGYYDVRVTMLYAGYLKGFWQCEHYFKPIKKQLLAAFTFPLITDKQNKEIVKKIAATSSVSIHIRRGDYLKEERNWAIEIGYYTKAIAYILQQIPDASFFVFSDDIAWAKENITQRNAIFIDWNSGSKSYVDMQLMSLCKHNIIANSSFSWWAAWLNEHADKIVVAPDTWVQMEGTRDVIPATWIKLPIK